MSSLDFLRICGDVSLPGLFESRNMSLGILCCAQELAGKLVGKQRVSRMTVLCSVVSWVVHREFMIMDLL